MSKSIQNDHDLSDKQTILSSKFDLVKGQVKRIVSVLHGLTLLRINNAHDSLNSQVTCDTPIAMLLSLSL
jgi:hypothetical protein